MDLSRSTCFEQLPRRALRQRWRLRSRAGGQACLALVGTSLFAAAPVIRSLHDVELEIHRDLGQTMEQRALLVVLQAFEQQDLEWAPHRDPPENQQTLAGCRDRRAIARITQQGTQEQGGAKDGDAHDEQGASDPHAPSISVPALYVRELEVGVNRTYEFGGMRLDRDRGMDDEPKRLVASVLTGRIDDEAFGVASERSLVSMERRGVQRAQQLLDALDPDIDGCRRSARGGGGCSC